jgi:hypothetical protein
MTTALAAYGGHRVALIGKARPDTVTPTLAKALAELAHLPAGSRTAPSPAATTCSVAPSKITSAWR